MLTEAQIRTLALGSGGLRRGGALFHLQDAQQHFNKQLPPGQRAMLSDIANRPETPPSPAPRHPETVAGRKVQRRDNGDLSPAELMWLQRLPTDPADVSFDDAVELASLARSISAVETPASARLINSIWAPVKQLHDRAVAQAELASAQQPLPALPVSIDSAMHEAVAAEFPGLGSESIAVESQRRVAAIEQERHRVHTETLTRAQRAAEQADQAQASHGSTLSDANA